MLVTKLQSLKYSHYNIHAHLDNQFVKIFPFKMMFREFVKAGIVLLQTRTRRYEQTRLLWINVGRKGAEAHTSQISTTPSFVLHGKRTDWLIQHPVFSIFTYISTQNCHKRS